MKRIHVARNHQPLGNFSPDEVAEGLQSGKFLPDDLAWRDPMESWKPLREFDDLPEVEAVPSGPPALPADPYGAPPSSADVGPAWERRAELGVVPAIVATVKQVLSVPVETFRTMKTDGGLGTPLLFFVIVFSLTNWAAMAYNLVALKVNPEAVLGELAKKVPESFLFSSQILSMIVAPVFVAASAFLAAAVYHLVFLALSDEKRSFETTFRAYCYAVAPASVVRLIPMCGDYLFFGIALLLLTCAMRETYRVSTGRAVTGVLLPALLCCGAFMGLGVAMVGVLAAQGMIK
ncbi:MAG TPA: YIP1 family protein [Terrimicrobiaceae bacterium]|nr:YIP1 family protein [Terrimicrobiaceae bacterium]